MGDKSPVPYPLGEYAQWYIRKKTRELIRILGRSSGDADDIRQHLTIELFRQCHRYDPTRASPNTYTVRVVDSAAGMLLRHYNRLKRGAFQRTQSTDAPTTESDDATTLARRLTVLDLERCTQNESKNPSDDLELVEAVAVALRRMPPQVRYVCERLMAGQKEAAIARGLGISRRQVRNLKEVAGQYLENAGLKKN